MGPDARLRRAFELSDFVRAMARDGIREAHPDWTEPLVSAELARRRFGRPERSPKPR